MKMLIMKYKLIWNIYSYFNNHKNHKKYVVCVPSKNYVLFNFGKAVLAFHGCSMQDCQMYTYMHTNKWMNKILTDRRDKNKVFSFYKEGCCITHVR